MQTAKVKAKDMVSTAKEKVKEGSAKMQGKTGEAAAATHGEKEMAREAAHARKDQANADKHQEMADHRAEAEATKRHGTGTGTTHVPITGPHDPAYQSAGGTYPASGKYV